MTTRADAESARDRALGKADHPRHAPTRSGAEPARKDSTR